VVGVEDLMKPPMNGGTPVWRTTSPFRRVLVQESSRHSAEVLDLGSGAAFSVQTTSPSGRIPRPGDIWYLSNEMGVWTFHKMIDPASDGQPIATAYAYMQEMNARNEIVWAPFDNPRSDSVETPQGAYIGQRGLFEVRPNDRWRLINGDAVSRHRYRALFELIGETYGAGDGVTTFNLPDQNSSYVSSGTLLVDSDYYSVTGGSDYSVTTTATTIPGLTHSFSIPGADSFADYTMEVAATVAIDNVYSGGLPDTEVVLRLNSTPYSSGGFSHSLEVKPVQDGFIMVSGVWKVTFTATGAQVIDLVASKADSTGTVSVVRKNTEMSCRLFKAGGSVSVSGSANWYICCE
jgi:microcystin-dependent protein